MATFCLYSHNSSPLDQASEHQQTNIFSACWDVYTLDVGTTFHTLVGEQTLVQMPLKWLQLPLVNRSQLSGIEVHELCDAECLAWLLV